MTDIEFLKKKYAAINAAKAVERAASKELKAFLNYVPIEDQSHLRDCEGKPLDNKYFMIKGKDCWYVWDTSKKRWKSAPFIR